MDNILIKIRESYCDLGDKDRAIAEFILNNENDIPKFTIRQIAEGCNVSQAAVVRFCKIFGSDGFKDFRRRLTTDMLEQAQKAQPTGYITADLQGDEDISSIVQRITANNSHSIQETEELLDMHTLENAIDFLADAPRIDFFGVGASGIVALDAHQKFIRIGKTCNASQDSHIQLTLASSLKPGDAAVAISYSGRTKDTIEHAAVAKERGAHVIVLTKYGSENPLAKLGDVVLYTTSSETVYRSSATSSRIAQLTMIDILFYGTVSRSIDTYYKNLENTYQYAAKKRLP